MPDGDRVYGSLFRHYLKSYKQVCQEQDPAAIMVSLAPAMKHDVVLGGNEPLILIRRVARKCASLPQEPLFKQGIDRRELSRFIDTEARKIGGTNRRAMAIAVEACKAEVNAVFDGKMKAHLPYEIAERYIRELNIRNFVERIPLAPHHFDNADSVKIRAKLAELHPFIAREAQALARNTLKIEDVGKLRLPRHKRKVGSLTVKDMLTMAV